MDELFPSQQHQEQDKCVDDTAFVYTGENMGLEEREKRERRWSGQGEGRHQSHHFLPFCSFSFIFFFDIFHKLPLSEQQQTEEEVYN